MANTYFSLYYHVVFSTKNRLPSINPAWRDRLYTYLGGTVRAFGGCSVEVGGVEDHVHMLMSLRATHCIADVLRNAKSSSSLWIHEDLGLPSFAWQNGYGAFSVSASKVESVQRYIQRQDEHHRVHTFEEEYVALLERSGVAYDPAYLW